MAVKKTNAARDLATKMVSLLRERSSDERDTPLTLAQLARLADPGASPRAALAALRQRKAFAAYALAARKDPGAPVALLDDLPRLAASPLLLVHALEATRTASNHAATVADLKKKLAGKLQAPFQEAVQRHVERQTLPPGVGWLLIKKSRKLFLLRDLHAGGVVAPPPAPVPAAAPFDFAAAFDAAFARLDHQAGGHNFVSLAGLRPELPCDRAAFDDGLRRLRVAGRYTLSAAEGRHGLTDAERAAGVTEDGALLLFVSRRMP
jgi:hypothetical protein